jgi:ABC transport system ATP-binding/permease protein
VRGVNSSRGLKGQKLLLPKPIEQIGSPSSIAHWVSEKLSPDAGPPPAIVIHEGRRIAVPTDGLTIGRSPDSDVVVSAPLASRHHARILAASGRWYVADLESKNGTFLNGERLLNEARWLHSGDGVSIGGEILRVIVEQPDQRGVEQIISKVALAKRLTVGRRPENDVQLAGPGISALHAEIIITGDRVEVIDHHSHSGTRVNGAVVKHAELVPGAEIGVGPYKLVFDGSSFIPRDDSGALRLEAEGVTVSVRNKVLLDRLSLDVQPGEFVAVIGESGSGKTTLLKVLAGVSKPTAGSIRLSGDPVESRLGEIGYLPQDEIVHPRLTVLESLRYSARLRLPHDSSYAEIDEAVGHAVAAVSLEHVAEQRVSQLSGGQRKRVGLATELLNHPGILFLDEPTTGLDVGLERQMMELFRSLAAVGRHAVIVVTHATHSLDQVDRLCVMGRGGHLCFEGTPHDALEFFAAKSFEDVYLALQKRPAAEWRGDFERERPPHPPLPEHAPPPGRHRLRRGNPRARSLHARVLTSRYLKVFVRDRLNLFILLMQAPVLAIGSLLLFQRNVLAPPGHGMPLAATQLVFLLVITTIWLGAIDASREIVKERAIFARERAVGVAIGPYLVSKTIVLFALVVIQSTILLSLAAAIRPFHEPLRIYLEVYGILALAGLAAVGLGLLVSGLAQTEDQATALTPVAMITQLFFSGAIVTVKTMTGVMAAVSVTSFSRWAFEGAGTTVDLNARFLGDPIARLQNPYGLSFFKVGTGETYGILAGFMILFFLLTALALSRKRPG